MSINPKYAGTSLPVSFHIGAFCFDARQFGAFHFGDFHFDAIPVRRVSLWRASTSARFSLARFHFGAFLFGAFPNFVRTYDDPVSAYASFARTVSFLRRNAFYASLARISFCVAYLRSCFLSAKKCFLRQFDAFLVLRLCYRHYQLASGKAMSTKTKRRAVCLKQCQLARR